MKYGAENRLCFMFISSEVFIELFVLFIYYFSAHTRESGLFFVSYKTVYITELKHKEIYKLKAVFDWILASKMASYCNLHDLREHVASESTL